MEGLAISFLKDGFSIYLFLGGGESNLIKLSKLSKVLCWLLVRKTGILCCAFSSACDRQANWEPLTFLIQGHFASRLLFSSLVSIALSLLLFPWCTVHWRALNILAFAWGWEAFLQTSASDAAHLTICGNRFVCYQLKSKGSWQSLLL